MRNSPWLFVTFGVLAPVATGPAADPLLDSALAAHQSARGQLQTVRCQAQMVFEVQKPGGQKQSQTCTSRCWYTPDEYRLRTLDRGREADSVWRDSVRVALGDRSATKSAMPTRHAHPCDPFVLTLLALNQPNTVRYVPLEQLVTSAQKSGAERVTRDGREVVAVILRFTDVDGKGRRFDVTIDLDPSVNHLVRRAEYVTDVPAGEFVREDRVDEFREVAGGVFFPVKSSGRHGLRGQQTDTLTGTISELVVNKPLPADTFTPRFQAGTIMADTIRGVSYPVNDRGLPSGKETPLEKPTPPPARADDAQPTTESSTEAPSRTRWVMPAALALLAAGVALAIVRGVRKAREQWSV